MDSKSSTENAEEAMAHRLLVLHVVKEGLIGRHIITGFRNSAQFVGHHIHLSSGAVAMILLTSVSGSKAQAVFSSPLKGQIIP